MSEDYSKKSVYGRISKIATELDKANLKKTGYNKYNEFYYFELADFLPTLNMLSDKYGVCNVPVFLEDHSELHVVNVDNPEDYVVYSMPNKDCDIKGAQPIQKEGGRQTYTRKYLLMNAYSITDGDVIDGGQNEAYEEKQNKNSQPKPKKEKKEEPIEEQKKEKSFNKLLPVSEIKALDHKSAQCFNQCKKLLLSIHGFDESMAMTTESNKKATEACLAEINLAFGDIKSITPDKYEDFYDYAIMMYEGSVGPEGFEDSSLD